MSDKSSKKGLQRFLILASGLVFLAGTITILLSGLFSKGDQNTQQTNTTQPASNDNEKLTQEAQGYEKVLKDDPNNEFALQKLAAIRLQAGDFQGALVPLEKLYQKYPNDPQIIQYLAQARLQTNDQSGAMPLLEKMNKNYEDLLKQDPNNNNALKGLASTRLQMEDFQGALTSLEKLYKTYPDDPQVVQYLAEVRLKTNNVSGAIELLEKLAQLKPDKAEQIKQVIATLKQQPIPTNPPK